MSAKRSGRKRDIRQQGIERMPTMLSDGTCVPALPAEEWAQYVARLIGRPVTADESERIEKLAQKNWTVRTVAEAILGRDLTEEEFVQRKLAKAENGEP